MEIVDIQCKDDLNGHKDEILRLFKEGFERELDVHIWNWAYLDNIFGDPIVSLAYEHDRLVAHYAVIPLHLANSVGKSLDSYLSMTTVVAKTHRKYGLFVALATRVNNLVKEKFDCEYRGEIEAKNKGKMKMYFVEGVTIDES